MTPRLCRSDLELIRTEIVFLNGNAGSDDRLHPGREPSQVVPWCYGVRPQVPTATHKDRELEDQLSAFA